MSFVNTWRLAFLGGLLSAVCLCSCATGPAGSRSPQEGLLVPFILGDTGWEVGHSAEDQAQRVTEFVRPGQTVENWTELVTWQTLNKAIDLGSVQDQFAAYQEDIMARCPGSTAEVIRELPDGILYEAHVVNCEQGSDEHILTRVLDGTWNRFLLQYAVRGAVVMTSERQTEWIDKLMTLQIFSLP